MAVATEVAGVVPSRTSWRAILSGTVLMLAIGLVLAGIGWGITFIVIGPDSLYGGLLAGAIILILATLIAVGIGGFFAGSIGSYSRRHGAIQGLVACGLAFLVSTFFWLKLTGATLGAVGGAAATTAQTTAQAAQAAAGSAQATQQGGGVGMLTALGYSQAEAQEMVRNAQASIQRGIRGTDVTGEETQARAVAAVDTGLGFFGGATLVYMGLWLIAMLIALAAGAAGAKRAYDYEPEGERVARPGYPPPLRPQEV